MESVAALVNCAVLCKHCGQSVPKGMDDFCCSGCAVVYGLLSDAGLSRFYSLRPKSIIPLLNYFSRKSDLKWVETLPGTKTGSVALAIEGLQCAACVWLISEVARKQGTSRVDVDIARGRINIDFDPQRFDLAIYLKTLQDFGYRTSPSKKNEPEDLSLLIRLGVCAAIAMNTMFLSICFYLGMTEGNLVQLFSKLNMSLSAISVLVGGSYFFVRAWQSLKNRVLHFDLPIAIGILAAFSGSVYAFVNSRPGDAYFDTVNIFIALMLAGRYAQERYLKKNQSALLTESGLDELRVTVLVDVAREISFSQVVQNDRLLIVPGSIFPVASKIIKGRAHCSLAWISGEALPVSYSEGDVVPAGACLLSDQPVEVGATTGYEASLLVSLKPVAREWEGIPFLWQWVTARYVLIVLTAAVGGLVFWSFVDASKALSVFTAVLVVTCPCSIGVAVPLARALANSTLLKQGIFARDGALLDKIIKVKKVLLDKTGTLTLASMKVKNPIVFKTLNVVDLQILFNAVSRSRHPASQALAEYLSRYQLPWRDIHSVEIPGKGLEAIEGGDVFRIGNFDGENESAESDYSVRFTKNGALLAVFLLSEGLVDDAQEALQSLVQDGKSVHLISGDKEDRVKKMANALGISDCYWECRPEDKARIVSQLDAHDTLMLGDGLNDSLAFGRAYLCGSPVWERSILAQSGDFFYVSGNLSWLKQLFRLGSTLSKTIRLNLRFALVYNVFTVSLALAGWMTPLLCAVFMPTGSLVIVGLTVRRMKKV